MRRHANIEFLSLKILFVLHGALFDKIDRFVSLTFIRSVLDEPKNSILLALDHLVGEELAEEKFGKYAITLDGTKRIDFLDGKSYDKLVSEIAAVPEPPIVSPDAPVQDEWEPLPLDRTTPEAIEAIEKAETALKEIEQNNGYAATALEERNGIVESIRGTLEAVKTGFPSRQVIIAGLLAPLRYISTKFGEATVGEAAKTAAVAIVKWLVSLGG